MGKRQVFFNCDHRGKLPISVAIYSLLKSADSHKPLHIYLAHDTEFIDNGGRAKVKEIVAGFPFASITCADITPILSKYPVLDKAKWPPVTWGWAFCTEIFPELSGNLVFIDWDMYVLHDLEELYALDLERLGMVSGAVNESLREHRPELIAAGWPESAGYSINTGLQVINTDAFRRERIVNKMLEWYAEHKAIAECVEQDAANVIYGDKILRLHLKYNFTVGWFDRILSNNPFRKTWRVYPTKMVFEACTKPMILHFIGHRKPWWWNHRAYRNAYREAMVAIGMFDPSAYGETFARKITGRIFDIYNHLLAAYAKLILKTIWRQRQTVI